MANDFMTVTGVHSPRMLDELVKGHPDGNLGHMTIPFNYFRARLAEVAEVATEIDDPRLNSVMMLLTLYSISDPDSPEYNPEFCKLYIKKNYGRIDEDAR